MKRLQQATLSILFTYPLVLLWSLYIISQEYRGWWSGSQKFVLIIVGYSLVWLPVLIWTLGSTHASKRFWWNLWSILLTMPVVALSVFLFVGILKDPTRLSCDKVLMFSSLCTSLSGMFMIWRTSQLRWSSKL